LPPPFLKNHFKELKKLTSREVSFGRLNIHFGNQN